MKELDIISMIDNVKTLEKLTNSNLNHCISILESANTIWEKCPFKIGDIVVLNKTPEITQEKSWGWLGSKHFLIEGARGLVKVREFYNGKFIFAIVFDDESWIDSKGIKHIVDMKSSYYFEETWLDPIQLSCKDL